jgi:hypothetical protein
MSTLSGRDKEALRIKQANRAAAVGRLMLGLIKDWHEFLEADTADLASLPRRQLKSGRGDVKKRLSASISGFCKNNFIGMTEQKLSLLYEEVKATRGLELPLLEFEERFAVVQPGVFKGIPAHLTVSISLWGLQYLVPEELLAKDVASAVEISSTADLKLQEFEHLSHSELQDKRDDIRLLVRQKQFGARAAVIACFNLMEAYLNGLAWDYLRTQNTDTLSNRQRNMLDDSKSTTIRAKLKNYPEMITGSSPWEAEDADLQGFLDLVKPFRDSLVHPSPFNAPEKFGGYDKLRLLYRVDYDTAAVAVTLTDNIIKKLHRHIKGDSEPMPTWMTEYSPFEVRESPK